MITRAEASARAWHLVRGEVQQVLDNPGYLADVLDDLPVADQMAVAVHLASILETMEAFERLGLNGLEHGPEPPPRA